MSKRRQNVLATIENNSPAKKQLSFDELLYSFILDCKARNLSPLTLRAYQDSFQQMKDAFEEQEVPLDIYSLTTREIKDYFIAYLIDQGKSDNTVNSRIKGLKQFLKFLFMEGWLTQSIADDIHVVKAE